MWSYSIISGMLTLIANAGLVHRLHVVLITCWTIWYLPWTHHILPAEHEPIAEADYQYSLAGDAFKNASKIDYIQAGDVMQVVLRRISVPYTESPYHFIALRLKSFSVYVFFNLDDTHIVGSSPEILARLEWSCASVYCRTRPRGKKKKILDSKMSCWRIQKKSVNMMLIDLGRNDIGELLKLVLLSC